jgi:hypothetical protein
MLYDKIRATLLMLLTFLGWLGKVVLFLSAVALVVWALVYTKPFKEEPKPTTVKVLNGAELYLLHDDERNITCYQSSSGLSCLPDNQLNQQK